MLTDRELLVAESRAPFSLRRRIDDAGNVEAVRRAAGELRPAVIDLHESGSAPTRIASIIGVLADALTHRLIELTVAELGTAPCPFTWLALGSIGRREAAPSSDVDSGLVWDSEDDEAKRYMSELGTRIVRELGAAGFSGDRYGVTAADPLFDRSFEAWRRIIRMSIEQPDRDKALIFISLLSDARPVHVSGNPRDPLEELGQVWHRRPLLRLMLRLALAHRPPSGLRRLRGPRRDLVLERAGEHQGKFDVKHEGLSPIVGIARYASLASGVRLTSTRERLDFASTAGVLDGGDARILGEAHELFWRLRLSHQVEQMHEDLEPDNYIDPESLNPVTRGYVREAFHAVGAVQRSLKGELALPPP